jgi:hypothetical protein
MMAFTVTLSIFLAVYFTFLLQSLHPPHEQEE